MINSKTAKQMINNLAEAGYKNYYDLKPTQRRELVALIIKEEKPIWKNTLLTDADSEGDAVLPDIIAEVIASNGNIEFLQKFVCKLIEIFVNGNTKKHAYYASAINDEFSELSPKENQINELILHDNYERIRDMQLKAGVCIRSDISC